MAGRAVRPRRGTSWRPMRMSSAAASAEVPPSWPPRPTRRRLFLRWLALVLAAPVVRIAAEEGADGAVDAGAGRARAELSDDLDVQDTCESCLAKGGGWCTIDHRCVDDDTAFCDSDSLIGLAGFTNDCAADEEGRKPKGRPLLDKGVLVRYNFENGTCCMGVGIVHRAYHVLEEYTVLLRDGSKEEVKTERWNKRKPAKKEDENSEYHNMEFRYFKPDELTLLSAIRPGDVVLSHFAVKQKRRKGGAATGDGGAVDAELEQLVRSSKAEAAVVINTTVDSIAVNFTSDYIVSIVPRDFVVDAAPPERPRHEEL